MSMLDLIDVKDGDDVDYYPYRQARVLKSGTVPCECVPREQLRELEDQLAAIVDARTPDVRIRPDNHTVYGVMGMHGQPVYLWFHDWNVYIGPEVTVDRY